MSTAGHDVLDALVERCRRDHHAWINGDGSAYELPEDGSIMGGVGGYSRGGAETAARQQAVAGQWRSGRGDVELVNGAVMGDMAWLALIERAVVIVDDERGEQPWNLRVTEVFRRVDGAWERLHRHADPLVSRRSLAEVTPLAL